MAPKPPLALLYEDYQHLDTGLILSGWTTIGDTKNYQSYVHKYSNGFPQWNIRRLWMSPDKDKKLEKKRNARMEKITCIDVNTHVPTLKFRERSLNILSLEF